MRRGRQEAMTFQEFSQSLFKIFGLLGWEMSGSHEILKAHLPPENSALTFSPRECTANLHPHFPWFLSFTLELCSFPIFPFSHLFYSMSRSFSQTRSSPDIWVCCHIFSSGLSWEGNGKCPQAVEHDLAKNKPRQSSWGEVKTNQWKWSE